MTDLVAHQEQQAAQHAQALQERIQRTSGEIRRLWLDLARDLHDFSEGQHWRSLGYGTFEEWMAGPDIDLDRTTVYRLLELYRELVVKRGVAPAQLESVEWTKLRETMPAIRRGHVTVDEAIADAEVTPRSDLRERYRQLTARSPSDPEPPIEPEAEPTMVRCPACGSFYAVRESS